MKISKLIDELNKVKKKEGDIEVTCTHALMDDGWSRDDGMADVFETTVENLIVNYEKTGNLEKRVRIWI